MSRLRLLERKKKNKKNNSRISPKTNTASKVVCPPSLCGDTSAVRTRRRSASATRFPTVHFGCGRHVCCCYRSVYGGLATPHWRSYMTVKRAIKAGQRERLKFMVAALCHRAALPCASFSARWNSVPNYGTSSPVAAATRP